MTEHERLLVRAEAAERLRIGPRTLERWERSGYGPRPVRIARAVRYRESDINAWIRQLSDGSAA